MEDLNEYKNGPNINSETFNKIKDGLDNLLMRLQKLEQQQDATYKQIIDLVNQHENK